MDYCIYLPEPLGEAVNSHYAHFTDEKTKASRSQAPGTRGTVSRFCKTRLTGSVVCVGDASRMSQCRLQVRIAQGARYKCRSRPTQDPLEENLTGGTQGKQSLTNFACEKEMLCK